MGDLPATITAITALIVAVGAIVMNFLRGRAAERSADRAAVAAEASKAAAESVNAQLVEIDGKIYQLTTQVDGKLTKLLDLTREAALAKGRLEGAATEKAEQAENGESKP